MSLRFAQSPARNDRRGAGGSRNDKVVLDVILNETKCRAAASSGTESGLWAARFFAALAMTGGALVSIAAGDTILWGKVRQNCPAI